ncbi:MAG: metallophosphoesterase family protein [Planctomycetes bacterium]|nr:metallophosphoesterase family protein [Planctomycetota bacterium]
MIALISDIHSNREALDAVFAVIDRTPGIEKIYCLGDVIGYGPEPEYCIDVVQKRCQVCLLGNHDEALFHGAHDFNPYARSAIEFTARRLKPGLLSNATKRKRWEYLKSRPTVFRESPYLFVHASPRDPVREYVLATDGLLNPEKLEAIFRTYEGICFIGHTHQPGIFRRNLKFEPPPGPGTSGSEDDWVTMPADETILVNVGSVGQPRDGDNRACFMLLDGMRVHWVRVHYEFTRTMEKIRGAGLDDVLARRLAIGR